MTSGLEALRVGEEPIMSSLRIVETELTSAEIPLTKVRSA